MTPLQSMLLFIGWYVTAGLLIAGILETFAWIRSGGWGDAEEWMAMILVWPGVMFLIVLLLLHSWFSPRD